MSWQAYVDTNLIGTGKIAHAAILGQQGGIWAKSADITISADEEKALIACHNNPTETQSNGLRVGGVKYFTLSADGRSVYGKKAADGIVVVKTKLAILVAVYVAPNQAGEVTPTVEGLADYLIGVGY